jgi:hypothetical protein
MKNKRRMLSNLNVINVLLAAVLLLSLNYTVLPLFGTTVRIAPPVVKTRASNAPAPDKHTEAKSPSPADYTVIAEQNLFHPERKIPVDTKDAAAPLPKPEFVLYGTLLTDDLQIAYMEDRKAPQNSPARGKKQIPVRLGESLSGFTLKEISTDKVVMVRGDEKLDVLLNDATVAKDRNHLGTLQPTREAGAAPRHAQPPMPQAAQHPPAVQPRTPASQPATQPSGAAPKQPVASGITGSKTSPAARESFMRLFQRK